MTKQDRLKFRVYHKPTNKIYNVYGFNDDFVFIDTLDTCEPFFREDCILLQCTGLKDEGEDLIYENDIVELDDGTELVNAVIEWDNNAGCWNIRTSDTIYTFDNLYGNEMRVIGNIHENPDLVENKDE